MPNNRQQFKKQETFAKESVISKTCHLTQRAPDGWDSVRFQALVLNFGSFPFRELVLPSRR